MYIILLKEDYVLRSVKHRMRYRETTFALLSWKSLYFVRCGGLWDFLREHCQQTVVLSQPGKGGGTVVTLPLLCYYARDGILQPEGSTAVRNHSCISSKSKTNVCMSCYSGSEHAILRLCQDLLLATIFFIITSPRVCTPLVAKKTKTKRPFK